jgi:hypothetical protein
MPANPVAAWPIVDNGVYNPPFKIPNRYAAPALAGSVLTATLESKFCLAKNKTPFTLL